MHELSYIDQTSLNHRKKFGQFFTPRKVADLMINWVTQDCPTSILDPAFGLGIFYESLQSLEASEHINYFAYEIDPYILNYFSCYQRANLNIYLSDYLEARINSYDAIICNPPYRKFQKFINRYSIIPKLEKNFNIKLNGYSNLASIFLLKSLRELKDKGRMAYLMPFEFFNTGYGKAVKNELSKSGLLKQIILFVNEKDIFADVTTTICIILCQKDGKKQPIKITKLDYVDQLESIKTFNDYFQYEISPEDLPYDKKWSPIISSCYKQLVIPKGLAKISDYGKFVRGIATGANEFFALDQEKAKELKINSDNLVQCLTKSSQVRQLVFTENDYNHLLENGKPVLCLNVIDENDENLQNYLEYGVEKGFNKRYLTRNRHPWYKLERRSPAPILAGVFNRGKLKVIRNLTDTISLTCFHSFYPNLFGKKYINRLFIYLISEMGQEILMTNKRQYGGNLDKFEPSDLNEGYCPRMEQFDQVTEEDANAIIELAKVNETEFISQANIMVKTMLD